MWSLLLTPTSLLNSQDLLLWAHFYLSLWPGLLLVNLATPQSQNLDGRKEGQQETIFNRLLWLAVSLTKQMFSVIMFLPRFISVVQGRAGISQIPLDWLFACSFSRSMLANVWLTHGSKFHFLCVSAIETEFGLSLFYIVSLGWLDIRKYVKKNITFILHHL